VSVGILVGDHLLSRDFEPYGLIFINMCIVIPVVIVMDSVHCLLTPYRLVGDLLLVKDSGPHEITFMNVCVVIKLCHGNAVNEF
jgi:hypothetical protein